MRETLRRHGISEKTHYTWKAKYGGVDLPEAKHQKHLEDKNVRLKRLVVNLALDIHVLRDLFEKRLVTVSARREAVTRVQEHKE